MPEALTDGFIRAIDWQLEGIRYHECMNSPRVTLPKL